MTKTPVKFQKGQHKTVAGVAHTRYPLSIHVDSIRASKMTKFKMRKKLTVNLRIISKPHKYLQTMIKTPVKFQKNRHKNVGPGGVAHTR